MSLNLHNKRLKRDCQRVAVFVQIGLCDYGCYFEFSVLRCQPLNRALCLLEEKWEICKNWY
ncbi:hypothetical protein EAY40_15255 [Vibrio anguillarum]|nr:hypothetical protein [Vibrio anguillarum]